MPSKNTNECRCCGYIYCIECSEADGTNNSKEFCSRECEKQQAENDRKNIQDEIREDARL
jgi:hypothetical protein